MGEIIYAFGDSTTSGTGITNPYPSTISAWKDIPKINKGIGGSVLADQVKSIYDTSYNIDDLSLFLTGYNDMRLGGNITPYQETLRATLAYMGTSTKQSAQSLETTGTWANVSSTVNSVGRWSATVGSTITATVTGSIIYIGSLHQVSQSGTFQVFVDGLSYGLYQTQGSRNFPSGKDWSPFLIRIDGLTNSQHTVIISVASGRIYVDWVGSPTPGQKVYVAGCLHMPPAGYPLGSPFNKGSDVLADQFTSIIIDKVNNLLLDGLNLNYIDIKYDPLTQVKTDNIHPNENGQATIAISFLQHIGF